MRNSVIDRARTFLTLVVVLHHAVIPYTYYGHDDPAYWIGFDAIVLANDSFFMNAFFFLSGLFVWPTLMHKTPRIFLRDRMLRLGLPFAICALTVIPLAYYAPSLRQFPDLSFQSFWWKTVTEGPWPSGPIWFLWVLLMFDLGACLLYRISPSFLPQVDRDPRRLWLSLITISWLVYVPFLLLFGAAYWFEFGPFSIQASRVLLYASYFFTGAAVGPSNLPTGLRKKRWTWVFATLISYALMWGMIYLKRGIWNSPPEQPWWYHFSYGSFLVVFSASILFVILGYFLSRDSARPSWLDRIRREAYGIFLLHYPVALWIQHLLIGQNWPAIAKASLLFSSTVLLSWLATAALMKIPGVKQVI